ncbi:excinuclease ABC subunit UvrC [Aestuariivirga litoralis]|uniref:excinuclease ABC subunit UvrC n=1 Tax=Aestuariivirga litoralis TaxID=2650924 RepID=UPI0018C74E68|nr:excinuclease ABC subunit UvrC [Aestuariivirga litoralis]MBG1230958.1 excinuclease ABC subunit UvrC [Aestuariivirga litoralis]
MPAMSDSPPLIGADLIRDFVTRLPTKPGVYRMFDDKGDAIYVGKARNLKARVSNYARGIGHNNRIGLMISLTRNMEFVVTASEAEALLLEANLIKKLKPKFNVILRDDKSFPYILIAKDHEIAQLAKHRGARNRKGSYYGPFASAGAVNNAINTMQKAFLLRSCNDSVYANRTRPCLLYQIKRCSAPCVGYIQKPAYDELVKEAEGFLTGKSTEVKAQLGREMEAAAEAMEFEDAARLRDRIHALSFVTQTQGINPQGIDEADVFGLAHEGGQYCIQVFFIRAGQNWGTRAYFPKADKSVEEMEVMSSFLTQFYDDKPLPEQILLSHPVEEQALVEEAFTQHAGYKVEILVPQRGEKKALIDYAVINAREANGRRMAETSTQGKLLEGVAKVFDLPATPRRIEVYDNSHIQGAHAVGAMIVAGPEGFIKAQYRKFNMDAESVKGDDFGMMREMLTRRFTRLLKEHGDEQEDEDSSHWPDLLLIDGGQGQLSAVKAVLQDLGLHTLPVAGVAKGPDRDAGREHFYMEGRGSFMLEGRDPVLYYIQRLRDEAHRFVIGSHRARRSRAIGINPLDEIQGIGPTRKKALLMSFGSAKAVARANVSDLAAVEGVSETLAQAIFDHFHPGN